MPVWGWAEPGEKVTVRFAGQSASATVFSINPEGCNLYNKEGLPASPFRTDAW